MYYYVGGFVLDYIVLLSGDGGGTIMCRIDLSYKIPTLINSFLVIPLRFTENYNELHIVY